jgi:hypothetical protein
VSSALWLALVVATTGCLDAFAPEVGPPISPAPDTCDTDTDPETRVTFAAEIEPLLADACNRCHRPGEVGVEDSGLDLTSYAALRAGGLRSADTIVIPGQPCSSVLWQKLGPDPAFGSRMPRDDAPLSNTEIDLVHDWIAEGALDD